MEILYEDKYILAVNKPQNMPCQPDKSGAESIVDAAEAYTGSHCHIINRLDRPVCGICILAKDSGTAAKMTELMKSGGTQKYYMAVVCGDIEESGTLTDYIFFNKRENVSKIVNKGSMGAKLAVLDFKRLQSKNGLSLVQIRLHTGRHHQIRLQLSHHGFPIWGDTKYNAEFRHKRNVNTALEAYKYEFCHPITNKPVTIELNDGGLIRSFFDEKC